jgi:hypothetical protein
MACLQFVWSTNSCSPFAAVNSTYLLTFWIRCCVALLEMRLRGLRAGVLDYFISTAVEIHLNFTKFWTSTGQSAALTNQRFSLITNQLPNPFVLSLVLASINSSPDFSSSSVCYELFVSEYTHAIHGIRIAGLGSCTQPVR